MLKLILGKLSDIQETAERMLAYAAVVMIMIMMFLTAIDILLRYAFNRPIPGTFELEQFLLVGVVFLTLAYIQSQRGHLRVEIFVEHLPRRVQITFDILGHVMCLVIFSIITWQSGLYAQKAWTMGEYTPGLIKYPLWPARWAIPIGSALFCLRYILDIILDSNRLRGEKR